MSSKLSRLSAMLGGGESEAAKGWKAKAEARAARIAELEKTIAALERRLARSLTRKAQIDSRLRSRQQAVPSADVLRQVLAVRALALPLLATDRDAARERDRQWRERSEEYRTAIEPAAEPQGLERTTVDGFAWWVPLDPRVDDRLERASRQGLPLRAILQTREVASGGVMLDLGANLGRTSIPRVILGDARVVYAAEPFPPNYAALVRNVAEYKLQGLVVPDRVAIGQSRGTVELRVSRFPGGHRLLHKQKDPVETIPVPVWPVDEWIERMGVEAAAVTFVKIDTQGSEVRVLRGAESLLARRHIAWQIEIDPRLLRRAGTPLKKLIALLEAKFTRFIDLGGDRPGPRSRPVGQLHEVLADLGTDRAKTDLILYNVIA